MKTYLVGYDLMKKGQDYTSLHEEIKKFGTWCHLLDSTWIIKSNLTALQIFDKLSLKIDNNDKLFIARLEGQSAWVNLGNEISDWLKKNMTYE